MIDEFLKTIKGELGEKLLSQLNVPSDKLEGVTSTAATTVKEGIAEKLQSGKINDILGLLGQGGGSSAFAGSLTNNMIGNFVSKLGLSKEMSGSIATVAVPFIIGKLKDFADRKGKNNAEGLTDLLGDVVKGSLKDKLLGGLGKKLGF
ncbi:MAG: hypothetical protein AB7U05_06240 [Mangrovibacterium sp.]